MAYCIRNCSFVLPKCWLHDACVFWFIKSGVFEKAFALLKYENVWELIDDKSRYYNEYTEQNSF